MYEFIKINNPNIDIAKRDTAFAQCKRFFGDLPLHLELMGNINPEALSDFLRYNLTLMRNRKFHADFFLFLRLHIAITEGYDYCKYFNTKLLKNRKYNDSQIESFVDIENFPLSPSLKLLAKKAMKAVFRSENFTDEDLQELYLLDWSIYEIYEVIEHIALLEKNRRIIKAFMKK